MENYLDVIDMLEGSDGYVEETASLLNEGEVEVEVMDFEGMVSARGESSVVGHLAREEV